MRIAVVFDCLYPFTTGGGEKQYRQFAEEFVKGGHEVDYLTRRQWDGPDPDLDGVRARAIAPAYDLHDAEGVRLPVTALRFALDVFRHLVRHRDTYDAVIVSATPVLNVFAARAALLGSRTVLAVDWLEVWTRTQWLEYSGPVVGRVADALQHLAVRLSPLTLGHSQHTVDGLRANRVPREPVRSPGLISAVRDVTPRLETPEETEPMVLFVGRHIQDKQVDSLPPALAEAREDLPGLHAVISGEGPERDRVIRAAAEAGVTDAVEFPGFVEEAELHRLLAEASCLVNPSRREGYGLVVVEAASYGTPSVVIDHPTNASTELIEEGVNGFVARSAGAVDLAAAITRAVRGGDALRRTTRAWYEEAIRTRTIAKTAEGILRALENAREAHR
ncbi:glycosyltransferase family 4 protein [Raineyella sp. W15-4]|uniref:glycosyltransferase family 4 protein n=1 Tax=Raineyella sp. W15-4 TaxID=3081651 RepID=UPI0029535461|nr:glycosyltransferase family 4 protein [Raineyella sp. W15-4]WOQ16449.1 glycosyltransferase family 4 protein [Raineyella sp. W15-4]